VILGAIGSGLAILALIGVLVYISTNYPALDIFRDQLLTILVLFGVLVLGVIITLAGTYFATQRFLNLRTDDLY
jgi:cell division transport system permease protein